MLGEPLVQVVGIGFGGPSALPLAVGRERGQFLAALGQDGAVALAGGLAGGCAQGLALAAIDPVAGLLQQGFHQARQAVAVGLDMGSEFADQVCATELVQAVRVAEVGGPAFVYQRAAIAGDQADRLEVAMVS